MPSLRSCFYFCASRVCLWLGMRRRGIKFLLMSFPERRIRPCARRSSHALNRRVRPRR